MGASKNKELTTKEVLYILWNWIRFVSAKWKLILLAMIIGAGFGTFYALTKKVNYTAVLTFALEDDKGGSEGGISSLANQFGFDVGNSAGGAFEGVANLIELMKSRTLISKALLLPITSDGKQISLANYLIQVLKLRKEWEKDTSLSTIQFPVNADPDRFSLKQNEALDALYLKIVGSKGMLEVSQKDKKTSILKVELTSSDELFSKVFSERIVKVVSDFYIETKSKKAKYNFDILQRQTDSVRAELNAAITGVAIANDNTYNLNPALNVKRISSTKKQVDVQATTVLFTQLISNLEMAKAALRKATPLVQIIDKPVLPLKEQRVSIVLMSISLGFIAMIFAVLIITARKIIEKIMSE